MKMVIAYIGADRMDNVVGELTRVKHLAGLTLYTGLEGFAYREGGPEFKGGISLMPRTKLEIICQDADVAKVHECLSDGGFEGAMGDGHIFVLPVEAEWRISTENHEAAA